MPRRFIYNGQTLLTPAQDPGDSFTPDDIRRHFIPFYPELANAGIQPRQEGEVTVIEFTKTATTLG